MTRVLQVVLGLLALFVVLVVAAVILIPMFVDPNDYREDIARAVEEETGRSFEIEGEISLSVFPWLGLEVGRMRLGNPPGFGDQPFAEIGSAAVGAKLLPLLSRRLEVSTLRLDGLHVHLIQLPDGSTNWEDFGDGDGDGDGEAAPPRERRDGQPGFRLERVDGLRLTDAQVRFEDRAEGTVMEATIRSLSTGELAPGRAFPVEADSVITLAEGGQVLATRLSGNVHFSDDFSAVVIRDIALNVDASGEAVPGGSARAQLNGARVDVDFEGMTGAIDTLGLSGEGSMEGGRQTFSAQAPAVRFAFQGPSFEIDGLELGFEASGPEVPGGAQSGRVSAPQISADLEAQTLAIPVLAIEAAGLRANGELSGSRIVDAPAFAGQFAVEEFSPRNLLERLGEPAPDTADQAVLRRASFDTRFQAGTDKIDLADLQLLIDDTTITGTAGIGFGEVMRVRSELRLDAIDLDRYLPPEEEVEAVPADDVPLAFDWLHGLDLDASFRAGSLKINGLTLTELQGRAVARDGVLTVEPLGAALYGGRVSGSARLDARQAPATFSLEQSLTSLQLQPFVVDLAGFEQLTGVAELGAKLTTTAASTAGLMSGLNGELSFNVADGALMGVNLWFEIQRAHALARGLTPPERSSPNTDFRRLQGTAVIRDGKLINQDLVGGLPFLGLTGRGEVDLAAAALDHRLNATVIREAVDEETGQRSELAGASLPLRLSGSLDSPSVSVDLGGLARDRAEQEVRRRLGVEEEDARSVEEELKDRALRGLRDRLRRDD
jgi:AsmA protein